MCGIAGQAGGDPRLRQLWVEKATASLVPRGPDAGGSRTFGSCTLGHRRLRIIDLSTAADQPMSNEEGTVWVCFNGEIYNFAELRHDLERSGHRFRSSSDTEVLVHLYEQEGANMATRLRGMFAFAVWDERTGRLLLVRDRLGIKPVYYRQDATRLGFASEARCLAGSRSDLDPAAVAGYLRLGWVPGDQTIFSGVRELPAGHLLEWENGRTTLRRWWQAGSGSSAPELREVVRSAFSRHLTADVPVGLFLSAGVDSTALAHLAAEAGADLQTLTVSFDSGTGEAEEAAATAQRLGLAHTEVRIAGAEVPDWMDSIVGAMDQPTVDGVNTWVISRAAREAGLTVALSGLGGDELFRGYSTFRRVPKLAAAARVAAIIPRPVRRRMARAAAAGPGGHALRRAAGAIAEGGWPEAYAAMRGVTGPGEFRRLLPGAASGGLDRLRPIEEGGPDEVTQLELTNYLPHQLLRDTDAMSMAHGLEIRVPLLDDEMVHWCLGRASAGAGPTKRHLAGAVDPALVALTQTRKRTFTLPFESWLHGPLQETARNSLDRLAGRGLGIDLTELAALWSGHNRGRVNWRTIWALVVLDRWMEQGESAPAE